MTGKAWFYYNVLMLLNGGSQYTTASVDVNALLATCSRVARLPPDVIADAQAELNALKEELIRTQKDPLAGIFAQMAADERSIREDPDQREYVWRLDRISEKLQMLNAMLFDSSRAQAGVQVFIANGLKLAIPFLIEGRNYSQEVQWQYQLYSVTVAWGIRDLLEKEKTLHDCFDLMQAAWTSKGAWKDHLVKGGIAIDAEVKWIKDLSVPGGPVQYWREGNLITL